MYAIIRAGGKQAKVAEGDVLDVERIRKGTETITFRPLLLVEDDGTVVTDKAALEGAKVVAEVLGEHRGQKIDMFTYKAKTGNRRRQGHRQIYTTIKITEIEIPGAKKATKKKAAATKAAAKSEAPEAPADADATPTGEEA